MVFAKFFAKTNFCGSHVVRRLPLRQSIRHKCSAIDPAEGNDINPLAKIKLSQPVPGKFDEIL